METFLEICKAFAALPPFKSPAPEDVYGTSLPLWHGVNEDAISKLIGRTKGKAEPQAVGDFPAKVEAALPKLEERLRREFDRQILEHPADASSMAHKLGSLTDAIIGAVTDWTVDGKNDALKQFSAVVEDFYVQPLLALIAAIPADKTPQNRGQPPVSHLPATDKPVATFSDQQTLGFHTISPDVMDRIISSPVGLVSMPTSYAGFPILWVALAHEICGHDIAQAFDRKPETRSRLVTELQNSLSTITDLNEEWRGVWQTWLEEAVADVYGMVFLGPHFAVGMAAWLSVTNTYSAQYPPEALGGLTNSFWVDGDEVSEHPPNLIRMHILEGALQALSEEPQSVIGKYFDMLTAMIREAGAGRSTVMVIDRNQGEAMFAYDAAPIIEDARKIGRYIASVKLKTLGSYSAAQLLPWTKEQKDKTAAFCEICLGNNNNVTEQITGRQFTSRHMLAGALMAVADNPALIIQINDRLQQGLSYRYTYPGSGSE